MITPETFLKNYHTVIKGIFDEIRNESIEIVIAEGKNYYYHNGYALDIERKELFIFCDDENINSIIIRLDRQYTEELTCIIREAQLKRLARLGKERCRKQEEIL